MLFLFFEKRFVCLCLLSSYNICDLFLDFCISFCRFVPDHHCRKPEKNLGDNNFIHVLFEFFWKCLFCGEPQVWFMVWVGLGLGSGALVRGNTPVRATGLVNG